MKFDYFSWMGAKLDTHSEGNTSTDGVWMGNAEESIQTGGSNSTVKICIISTIINSYRLRNVICTITPRMRATGHVTLIGRYNEIRLILRTSFSRNLGVTLLLRMFGLTKTMQWLFGFHKRKGVYWQPVEQRYKKSTRCVISQTFSRTSPCMRCVDTTLGSIFF